LLLIDLSGRTIYTTVMDLSSKPASIPLLELSPGVYQLLLNGVPVKGGGKIVKY
jgi:hypothetical protein